MADGYFTDTLRHALDVDTIWNAARNAWPLLQRPPGMLNEPCNENLKMILRATEGPRRSHAYDLDDLLKVLNVNEEKIRFTTFEVHALLNGGYAQQDFASDIPHLTLPQAGIWDILRVAIDLCDSVSQSNRKFYVVEECLKLMLDSSLTEQRDLWLKALPMWERDGWLADVDGPSFDKVVKDGLLDYHATIDVHDDGAQRSTDLFSHVLMNFREYQGNYLYRITRDKVTGFVSDPDDILAFLDVSDAEVIEPLTIDFLRYVPRIPGMKIVHDDDFLCNTGSDVPNDTALGRLVRVLLIGAIGTGFVHCPALTGDEDLEVLINDLQHRTFRPIRATLMDSISHFENIVGEVFVAQLESCIHDLAMAGTWNFAQGRGTYPAHWNTYAIDCLAGRESDYAKRLLALARSEDEKNRSRGDSFWEDDSHKPGGNGWGLAIPVDAQRHGDDFDEYNAADTWNGDSTQPAPNWPDKLLYDDRAWQGSDQHNLIWNEDLATTEDETQAVDAWFDQAAGGPESVNDNREVANLIWQNSPPGFVEDVDHTQQFLSWDEQAHGRRKAAFDDWFIDWNDVFVNELPTFAAGKKDTYEDSAIGDVNWDDDHTAAPATSGQWDDDAEKTVDWNNVTSLTLEICYSGAFSVRRAGYSDDHVDWNSATSLNASSYFTETYHVSKYDDAESHVDWNSVISLGPDSYFSGRTSVYKDEEEVSLIWEVDHAAKYVLLETTVPLYEYTQGFCDWNRVTSADPRSYGEMMHDDRNGSDLGDLVEQEGTQPALDWGDDAAYEVSWDVPASDDNNTLKENLTNAQTLDWWQDDVQKLPAFLDVDNAHDPYCCSDACNNENTFTRWSDDPTSNWDDAIATQAASWGHDDTRGLSWDAPAVSDETTYSGWSDHQTSNWNDNAEQQAGSWGGDAAQSLAWDDLAEQEHEKHHTEWSNDQIFSWNDHAAQQPASWNDNTAQDLSWDAPAISDENTYTWDSHQVSDWNDHGTQDLLWDTPAVNDDNTFKENVIDHALDWGHQPSYTWSGEQLWPEDVAEPIATSDNDAFAETSFDWNHNVAYRTAASDGQVTKHVTSDNDRNLSWEGHDASQDQSVETDNAAQNLSWENNDVSQHLDWDNDDAGQSMLWENYLTAQHDSWENRGATQDVSWGNEDAHAGTWSDDEANQTLTWENYDPAQQLSWENNDDTQNLSWNANTQPAVNDESTPVFPGDSASDYAADNDDGNEHVSAELDWDQADTQPRAWDWTFDDHNEANESFDHGDQPHLNSDNSGYNPATFLTTKSHKSVAWYDNIATIAEPSSNSVWHDNTYASPRSDHSEQGLSDEIEHHDNYGSSSAWFASTTRDARYNW